MVLKSNFSPNLLLALILILLIPFLYMMMIREKILRWISGLVGNTRSKIQSIRLKLLFHLTNRTEPDKISIFLSSTSDILSDLITKVERKEIEYKKIDAFASSTSKELSKLSKNNKIIEIESRKFKLENEWLNEKIKDLKKDKESLIEELSGNADYSSIELTAFLGLLSILHLLLEDRENLTKTTHRLLEEKLTLEDENVILRKQKLDNKENEINKIREKFEEKENLLTQENKDLSRRIKDLKKEKSFIDSEFLDLNTKFAELQGEQANAIQENNQLRLNLLECEKKAKDLNSNQGHKSEDLQLNRENEKLRLENESLKLKISNLESKVKDLSRETRSIEFSLGNTPHSVRNTANSYEFLGMNEFEYLVNSLDSYELKDYYDQVEYISDKLDIQ